MRNQLKSCICLITLLLLSLLVIAPTRADEIGHSVRGLTGTSVDSAGNFPQELANDGSMAYSVPIEAPPARGEKVTPRLALNYHSKARDGWLGAGWNLSMTYIEADVMLRTPSASDALTDTAGRFRDARFVYVNNQVRRALVSTGPNQYRMQVEDRYLAFSFNGSDWEAFDGVGIHYFFSVRQLDNLGVAVRWYLSMVTDTNQNWTGFLYRDSTSGPQDIITKTPNAVFLRAVVWNGINPPSYAPADWQRSWSALFKNRIEFVSEPRSDKVYVGEFGVLSTITERLKEIQVFSEDQNGLARQIRTYYLEYAQGFTNQRSLLRSVQVTADGCHAPYGCPADSVLPATSFTYSLSATGFTNTPESVNNPAGNMPDNMGRLTPANHQSYGMMDLNGDGRADYLDITLRVAPLLDAEPCTWSYYANRGGDPGRSLSQTFDDKTEWAHRETCVPENNFGHLIDMNGDGLPDYITSGWGIRLNTGGTFDTHERTWDVHGVIDYLRQRGRPLGGLVSPTGLVSPMESKSENVDLNRGLRETTYWAVVRDITGDGIPDYIYTNTDSSEWWVFPGYILPTPAGNVIGGFTGTPIIFTGLAGPTPAHYIQAWFFTGQHVEPPMPLGRIRGNTYTDVMLIDLNGDGLLDLIPSYFSANPRDPHAPYTVYLNTGRGFVPVVWGGVSQIGPFPEGVTYLNQTTHTPPGQIPMIRQTIGILDINGDSFPDFIYSDGATMHVYYGTGSGFTPWQHPWLDLRSGRVPPPYLAVWEQSRQIQGLADLNGDGLLDYVHITQVTPASGGMGQWSAYWHPGTTPNLGHAEKNTNLPDQLVKIDNGVGGGLIIFYQPSTAFGQVRLPFITYVVSRLQLLKGQSPLRPLLSEIEGTPVQIQYENGALRNNSRTNLWEFRGFGAVRRARSQGSSSRTRYETQEDLIGRPRSIVDQDADNCAYHQIINEWSVHRVGPVGIPFLRTQAEDWQARGPAPGCAPAQSKERTRTILAVDDFGNVLQQVDGGDLVTPVFTMTDYARSASGTVVSLPARVTRCATGDCAHPLSATVYRYDGVLNDENNALPEKAVERGNLKIVTQYNYNLATPGRAPEIFDTKRYAYDSAGNRIATVDMQDARNGKRASIQFDTRFNLFPTQITNGLNVAGGTKPATPLVTQRTYDMAQGFVASETDPNNQTTYFTPDHFGRVARVEIVRQGGRQVAQENQYQYTNGGMRNVIRQYHTATQIKETHEDFDGLGRRTRKSSALGADVGNRWLIEEAIQYDALGRPQVALDPGQDNNLNRMAKYYFYDGQGRVATLVHMPYLGAGLLPDPAQTFTDQSRSTFVTRYRYAITQDGFVTDTVDPNNTQSIVPPTFYTRLVRDVHGRIVQSVDQGEFFSPGNQTSYAYDDLDHLIRVSRTLTLNTDMGCRPPRCSVTVPVVVEMSYDSLGRKLWMRDPDKGQMSYQYDSSGNRLRTEFSDITSSPPNYDSALIQDYDILGRVSVKRAEMKSGGRWVADASVSARFAYDSAGGSVGQHPYRSNLNGRLASVSDLTGATYFGYDEQGNNTHFVRDFIDLPAGSRRYSILRTFSRLGRPESINYNGLEPVYNSFNSAGWLKSVDSFYNRNYFTALTYDELGHPTGLTRRDGEIVEAFSFNAATHRLENLTARGVSVTPLLDLFYTYDAIGNVTEMTDRTLDRRTRYEFHYDQQYHLRTAWAFPQAPHAQSYSYSYVYDSLGNLRKKLDTLHNIDNMVFGYRDDGLQPHAAVAYAHRRQFTVLSSQGAVYSHGNLSQDVDASGFAGREFFYTAENNLRQMNSNQLIAPSTTTYGYDGFGQRAWQRLSVPRGGTMTVYYVGPWMDVVVNGAASGGGPSPTIQTRRHIYAGGMRLMTKTSTPTNWDGDETHYITDYQGSVRATLDQFGNVLTRTNYLPFGQIDEATSTGTIQFGFTGQELGMADGLCFYNARYYDPWLMRFLTPDAIVPDPANNMAFNRYAYVYNNPVSFIDPSGHDPILMASLIGALIGGISGGVSGYIAAEEAGRNPWVGALIGAGIGIFAGGVGAGIGDLVGTGVAGAVGGASGSTSSALLAAPAGSTLLGNVVGGAINGAISSFGQALGSGLAAHHVDFGEIAKQTGFGAIQGAFRGRPDAIGAGRLGLGLPTRPLMEGVGGLVTSALKGESLGQGFINGFSRGWGIGAGELIYTGVDPVNIGSTPFEKGIDAFFALGIGTTLGAPWAIGGLIGWASDSTTHGFSKGSLEGIGYANGGALVLGGLYALLSWGK